MRLAELPRGVSRRQTRRENQAAAPRGLASSQELSRPQTIKPVKLDPQEIRLSEVALPPNEFNLVEDHLRELPTQESLLHTCIRPMRQAEMVLLRKGWEENPEVRPSLIHDIDNENILHLAQTSPPVLRSDIGREAEISFLARYMDVPGGRWLRVGYKTQILDVILGYRLNETTTENVVTVKAPSELTPVTLRLAYRITPPEDLDMRLVLWPEKTPLGLMDLSAGGLKFYHDIMLSFSKHQLLNLALLSGVQKLVLEARVVRSEDVRDIKGKLKGATSVTFTQSDETASQQYIRFLTEVYRHLLARRSGLGKK